MNRLHPPPRVLEIAERLERAGHEAWCVGGAIRDALLGHPHLDWDLATSATPAEVRALFGDRRTIPIGVEFGTVGVLDRDGAMHEVTTFRRDVRTDGRHAEVEFGASLDDDLARRDFTMRAIAGSAPYLGRLSPERVKQELDKTMEQVRRPSAAFALWQSSGAFATLVPPLANATPRDLSVPDHLAMPSGSARPARRALRFAGLLAGLGASGAERVMTALRSSKHELQLVGAVIGRWERLGEEMTRTVAAASAPT